MRDYLKILSSIIAALLTLAALTSTIAGIYAVASSSSVVVEVVLFPFAIAWGAFIMFGITGSLLWFVFVKLLSELTINPIKKHVIAASASIAVSWLAISIVMASGGIKGLAETAPLLVLVVPVVVVSLLWYWFLYQRPQLNNANDGDH